LKAISSALIESFKNWGSKDPIYKKTYKKIDQDGFRIVIDSFSELDIYKPAVYDMWWQKNHGRYNNAVPDRQRRYVHQLVYEFLTKYSRGKLNESKAKKNKPKTRAVV
jgi:hypothetical protein